MHKNNTIIILIMLILSAAPAAAVYAEFGCTNNPPNVDSTQDFSCRSGAAPVIWCVYDEGQKKFLAADCAPKCAKACGQMTMCHTVNAQTCEVCCGTNTVNSNCKAAYPAYNWGACFFPTSAAGKEACSCQQSCIGTCDVNKQFCDIINLLYIVVGIAAAVIIAIHGLMWIKSEDAHGRNDAKNGIWYVIIGVIVIVAASAIVGFLLGKTIFC